MFERRLERKRLVDPGTIGKRQTGPTAGTPVGKYDGYELRREGAELVGGLGLEEGEQLVEGGATGASRDEAQNHMEGQRRVYQIGVLALGTQKVLGYAQRYVVLVADRFAEVHCEFAAESKAGR